MMENKVNNTNSVLKKFFVILLTLLCLLIPIAFLHNIVSERENYRNEAVAKVANSWASSQTIQIPKLVLAGNNSLELGNYNADIKIDTETRKKGIFSVPVYTADVVLKGTFVNNTNKTGKINAALSFDVSDAKGFVEQPKFKLPDNSFVSFSKKSYGKNIALSKEIPFEIQYKIRGIKEIYVIPAGENNKIQISGNWANPSFEGSFLPTKRKVDKDGFEASWSIPKIAASVSQEVVFNDVKRSYAETAEYSSVSSIPSIGVSLLTPVDNYRMALRAVKYAFLFLGLTFLAFYIFEITSKEKRKIHPLQYLMMGAAMLIFYLLLVSISEFIPFFGAYLVAAVMTILLIALYTYFVLTKRGGKSFTFLIAGILTILYAFLYTLLVLQDLSLILGSIGLFVTISLVMYSTRNIEWYQE